LPQVCREVWSANSSSTRERSPDERSRAERSPGRRVHSMTALLIAIVVLCGVLAGVVAAYAHSHRQRPTPRPTRTPQRILFPFAADELSVEALDCALRLASAENATLVPAFLARVSLILPLGATLPGEGAIGMQRQDAIAQRAHRFSVPIDPRIDQGRTYRHALRQAIASARYDRIVIAAAPANRSGITPEDIRWLLDNAPGEIVVIRPNTDHTLIPPHAPPAPGPLRSLEPVN
jgi:hypothetical protein